MKDMRKLAIPLGLSLAGCLVLPALLLSETSQTSQAAPVPAAPATAKADSGDELRRAASAGDAAKVRQLLAAGADVNAANAYGGTALAFACDKGHTEVVKVLLEHGANLEIQDRFYKSKPLAWAVIKGHPEIARLLLEHGAQGEAEALSTAVVVASPKEIVQMIVARGKVSPEELGEALRTARQQQKTEIAGVLEAAGAKVVPVVPVDATVLAAAAGTYEAPSAPPLTLTVDGDKLKVTQERGGSFSLEVIAVEPLTLRPVEFSGFKVIATKEGGVVNGFDQVANGETTHFRKTSGGKP
jgi:Ankyrin repeats (3 copies)